MTRFIKKHIFNQLLSSITAFLTLFVSGIWLGYMSAVLPKLKSGEIPISMSSNDITWAVGLLDIGNFLSPIPTSYFMNSYGRLLTLRLASVSFAVASISALLASTPSHLFAARFFCGLAKGVGFTGATLYVAEIAGPKIRGALSGIFIVMLTGGMVVSMSFGPYVSFQALNILTLIFPTVGFLLTFFIVESPYYFCIQNDEKAATAALAAVRDETKTTSTSAEMEIIQRKIAEVRGQKSLQSLFCEKGNRRALLIIIVTGMLERTGGISSILAYASTTLPPDPFWDGKITVMIFSWLCVASGLLGMSMVDSFGRKPLQIYSALGLAFVMGISAVFYYFYQNTDADVSRFVFVPHVGIIMYGVFYPIGTGQIPHTFQSELFSTSVKGHASAIMTMALGVASFASNKMYYTVDHSVGIWLMYAIFAASNLTSMIFTVFYVFETKGKTLAEIQDLLNK